MGLTCLHGSMRLSGSQVPILAPCGNLHQNNKLSGKELSITAKFGQAAAERVCVCENDGV
jgi:hypothetical protein